VQTLRSDPTPSPDIEDFVTEDGYYIWQDNIGKSMQEVFLNGYNGFRSCVIY
jgi:hypothetical protein